MNENATIAWTNYGSRTGQFVNDWGTATTSTTWIYPTTGEGSTMRVEGDKYLVIDVTSNCVVSEHKTIKVATKAAEKGAAANDHEYVVYKPLVSVRPKKETVTEDVEVGG